MVLLLKVHRICALTVLLLLTGCHGKKAVSRPNLADQVKSLKAHDPRGALKLIEKELKQKASMDDAHVRLWVAKSQILHELESAPSALASINSAPQAESPLGSYLIRREQASLESNLGLLADADQHLAEANEFARKAGKPRYVASTNIDRCFLLLKLNRPDDARKSLEDAKRYGESTGDRSWDAYILKATGRFFLALNQFEAAIGPLQASHQLFLKEKKTQPAGEVGLDLAWAYYRLGRLDKAQVLYEECEQSVPIGDKHSCLGHLGNIFYDLGDLKRAAAYYRQAADLAKNQNVDYYSSWLVNLATTLTDEEQWAEAALYNSEALIIAKRLKGSNALSHAMVNAGRIAAGQHDYTAAERQLLTVEYSSATNPAAVLDAYAALARMYAETNRPEAAKRQFETAVRLVDGTRTDLHEDEDKLSYLASLIKLHQQYVAFLMKRGDIYGALQASETSRARVLRDRVRLKKSTVVSHGIADYQRTARANDAAYLVYWVAPELSYLWVISADKFSSYTLPGAARIRALVERHQRTSESSPSEKAPGEDAAAELFNMVAGPALSEMPKVNRFIIVPDGPLYGINFETLRKRSRYWIEDSTIAIAPSLELLLGKSAPRPTIPTALLIGDALEWTPEFPRLFNALKELTWIGEQFPKSSETLLAGAEATPAAFAKADPSKFSYIHFAAHAVPNLNSPLDSAIILSQGQLSVKDVLATPVQARLVTISACSSAGAKTYAGEGLVGLAWAFLQSGAHGVVAGLWSVNDNSSPILMQALYQGLLAGQQPADALRMAKLKLLEPGSKYADPYYWGPFLLYRGAGAN